MISECCFVYCRGGDDGCFSRRWIIKIGTWTEWPTFYRWHFQMRFLAITLWYLFQCWLRCVLKSPNGNLSALIQVIVLATSRRHAINYTRENTVYWRIYVSPRLSELMNKCVNSLRSSDAIWCHRHGSNDGLLPAGAKPLPEPILSSY